MLDKEKLEQLIITNWTVFIDYRLLRDKIQHISKKTITTMKMSRFEFIKNGFLVWVEIDNEVIEIIFDQNGNIQDFSIPS